MAKFKPLVIAFEGLDKAGKTTQADLLEKFLSKQGVPYTRINYFDRRFFKLLEYFTSKSPEGNESRNSFIGRLAEILAPKVLPVLTSFTMHINKMLSNKGSLVFILDRSAISNYAFVYGMTQNDEISSKFFSKKPIKFLMEKSPWPDFTIYLNISDKVFFERLKREKARPQMHENLGDIARIKSAYVRIIKNEIAIAKPTEWKVIDGSQKMKDVQKMVLKEICTYAEKAHPDLNKKLFFSR